MSASASASSHDRGHHKIGPTAHVTAYAWHQLGLPYANLFATREGATMYWAFRGAMKLNGNEITIAGDRRLAGPFCAQSEKVFLGWPQT